MTRGQSLVGLEDSVGEAQELFERRGESLRGCLDVSFTSAIDIRTTYESLRLHERRFEVLDSIEDGLG
jgi:hypothetical protein